MDVVREPLPEEILGQLSACPISRLLSPYGTTATPAPLFCSVCRRGDPIADRIREAIEPAAPGSSKHQIRRLFHGHLRAHRIDTALEKLLTLGAISTRTEPTGGRPSSLWSVMPRDQHEDWTHRQRKTKSRRKMNRWTSSAYGSFGALFFETVLCSEYIT